MCIKDDGTSVQCQIQLGTVEVVAPTELVSCGQTPPLFEIGQRGESLVNWVDFSVPAKEFGCRCWYEN